MRDDGTFGEALHCHSRCRDSKLFNIGCMENYTQLDGSRVVIQS